MKWHREKKTQPRSAPPPTLDYGSRDVDSDPEPPWYLPDLRPKQNLQAIREMLIEGTKEAIAYIIIIALLACGFMFWLWLKDGK